MTIFNLNQKVSFVFSCLPIIFALNQDIQEVEEGHNVVLQCESIDDEHVFMFWYSPENGIIGPRNEFNRMKFQYEVISGNLTIRGTTRHEGGLYNCISEGISTQDITANTVNLIVRSDDWEPIFKSKAHLWTAWAILGSILIVLIILYIVLLRYYQKSDKNNLRRYFDMSEANEDEDSTEELFTREPSTSGTKTTPIKSETDNFEKMYTAININHA